jgi:hypothetical protein
MEEASNGNGGIRPLYRGCGRSAARTCLSLGLLGNREKYREKAEIGGFEMHLRAERPVFTGVSRLFD